ncbi:MAG: BLUF domain-containing protein, partial [Pseudomonadota bacterium]
PAGVTGMLLYHEGSFLQALEGDRAVVEALYERIEEDPRLHHLMARSMSPYAMRTNETQSPFLTC